MLSPRLPALFLIVALPACSSGGSSSSSSSASSSGSGTGGTGGTHAGAGGAPATSASTSVTTGPGGAGGADAGERFDAANLGDALGKGGLPLGADCGASAAADAGMCGEGLACCAPCAMGMCPTTVCTIACSPQMFTCVDGCMLHL